MSVRFSGDAAGGAAAEAPLRFRAVSAQAAMKAFPRDTAFVVTYEDKLKVYALTQQMTQGSVPSSSTRPPFTDVVGRVQWEQWRQLRGMSKADAMAGFVQLVRQILDRNAAHPDTPRIRQILERPAPAAPRAVSDVRAQLAPTPLSMSAALGEAAPAASGAHGEAASSAPLSTPIALDSPSLVLEGAVDVARQPADPVTLALLDEMGAAVETMAQQVARMAQQLRQVQDAYTTSRRIWTVRFLLTLLPVLLVVLRAHVPAWVWKRVLPAAE